MENGKTWAALLAALAILAGYNSGKLRGQDWPGNDQPRLEVTQNLLEPAGPGRPFALDVCVRNLGSGVARAIHVTEKLPDAAELIEAAPVPLRQGDLLQWTLATLKPGEEYHVRLRLRADNIPPTGEWPNRVRVAYQTEVGNAYSIDLKRPKLELSFAAPKFVLLGETTPVEITVKNTGTWTGHHLNLVAAVSGGLTHETGTDLENEIGDLPAGQSCSMTLPLNTIRTGKGYVQLRLTSEEIGLTVETLAVDIRDVHTELAIQGPASASVDWACTYNFIINNEGGEALPATKLVAEMPKNLAFNRASGNGIYEPSAHTVTWDLPECKPGESLTCVLSGVSRSGTGGGGRLQVLHNKHLVKGIPWTLNLLDHSSNAMPLPTPNNPAGTGPKK